MSKRLLIVESPAKARTIQKYLGRGFQVKATVGHVIDLPKSKLGVDLDNQFQPEFQVIRGKAKVLKELLAAAKKSEKVLLAMDRDREGEAIAWHLMNHLAKAKKPFQRITFNEITKRAIQNALAEPGEVNERKVNAQQARRILDRLVGYQVSPQLWRLFYKGLSAGRVQTVALRLVCEREQEIEAFQQEEYWTVHAEFRTEAGETFEAELTRLDDQDLARHGKPLAAEIKTPRLPADADPAAVVARAEAAAYQVAGVERKEKKRSPRPPFITSTLQQAAAGRFGFSAKKTMTLAQRLYEGVELGPEGPVGMITYMRTDSVRLAADAQAEAFQVIGEQFGPEFQVEGGRGYRGSKKAQDAHEAIRPTRLARLPETVKPLLDRDLFRLYDLIWRRTMASQMPDARLDQTTVRVAGDGLGFRATGSVITFEGHLRVLPPQGDDKQQLLPAVSPEQDLTAVQVEPRQHLTKPPARYRDASLVRELEKLGIGRPSTYANIISTLIDRNYVERQEKQYHPTVLGREVWLVLEQAFSRLFGVDFTALMEDELDRIEAGELEWRDVVRDFYGPFRAELAAMERNRDRLRRSLLQETDIACPKCGSLLVEKWGKSGKFLSCPRYPECKHSQPLPGDEVTLDESCPRCGEQLQVRSGRFGQFVACTGYPDCKFTRPVTIGVKCPRPDCDGDISERRSKRGRTFYGCTRYPDCDFVSWDRPVDRTCTSCGNNYLVQKNTKAKGKHLICPQCKTEALE